MPEKENPPPPDVEVDVEQLTQALAAPFDLREVKFKPGVVSGNRALALAYVDARVIQDRLDEVLGVTGSSVTTACKRLEKSGLLKRTRQGDGQDQRVVLVTLTAQGREQIEAWQQERRNELSKMLAPLSPSEQAELQRLIERILEQ